MRPQTLTRPHWPELPHCYPLAVIRVLRWADCSPVATALTFPGRNIPRGDLPQLLWDLLSSQMPGLSLTPSEVSPGQINVPPLDQPLLWNQ